MSPPSPTPKFNNETTFTIRGIKNVDGTACHTSSVLQLLFHCFPCLRDRLLDLALVGAELINFMRETKRNEPAHPCSIRRDSGKFDDGKSLERKDVEDDETETIKNEFVHQLARFFYLLAYANDSITAAIDENDRLTKEDARASKMTNLLEVDGLDESTQLSNEDMRRRWRKMKIPYTPRQRDAIDAFIASAHGSNRENKNEHWRKVVDMMKEFNKMNYNDVLSKVVTQNNELSQSVGGRKITSSVEHISRSRSYDTSTSFAIDPTIFYEQLSLHKIGSLESCYCLNSPINTKNIGDAAMVFRSLVHLLETSVEREVKRLQKMLENINDKNCYHGMERESENKEDGLAGDSENHQRHTLFKRLYHALSAIKSAIKEEWGGTLLSRIVGTCHISEGTTSVSYTSESLLSRNSIQKSSESDATENMTILQLTKKNGNIERKIPIPFSLPIVRPNISLDRQQNKQEPNENSHHYYESLNSSLFAATIKTDPIRGYDWQGMIKEGNVLEKKISPVADVIEVKKVGEIGHQRSTNILTNEKIQIEGVSAVQAGEEINNAELRRVDKEDSSVTSRSIGIQTKFNEGEGNTFLIAHGFDDHCVVGEESELNLLKRDDNKLTNVRDYDEIEKRSLMSVIDDNKHDRTNISSNVLKSVPHEFKGEKFGKINRVICDNEMKEEPQSAGSYKPLKRTVDYSIGDVSLINAAVAAIVSRPARRATSRCFIKDNVSSRKSRNVNMNKHAMISSLIPPDVISSVPLEESETSTSICSPLMTKPQYHAKENDAYSAAVSALIKARTDKRFGMQIGLSPVDVSPMEDHSSLAHQGKFSSHILSNGFSTDSESVENSTIDSHVSSVMTNSSNEKLPKKSKKCYSSGTDTSDIETPSDIEDLSLGSFTDDSNLDDIGKENGETLMKQMFGNGKAEVIVGNQKQETESKNKDIYDPVYSTAAKSLEAKLSEKPYPCAGLEIVHSHIEEYSNSSSEIESTSSSYDTSSTDSTDTSNSDEDSYSSSDDDSSSSSSHEDSEKTQNYSFAHTPVTKEIKPTEENASHMEWITRKETRFRHPLPKNLIFHLKRFEFSNTLGRVINLGGAVDIPGELNLKTCCFNEPGDQIENELKMCCYHYSVTGAIVYVDPSDDEKRADCGEGTEGHYVTLIKTSAQYDGKLSSDIIAPDVSKQQKQWVEIDDEQIRPVNHQLSTKTVDDDASSMETLSESYRALKILSGSDVLAPGEKSYYESKKGTHKERERRFATLVVYSRVCRCNA